MYKNKIILHVIIFKNKKLINNFIKNNLNLLDVLISLITLLVYTIGKFQLFDLIGVKKFLQIILIVLILFFVLLFIFKNKMKWSIILTYITIMLITNLFFFISIEVVLELILCLFVTYLVTNLSYLTLVKLLKTILNLTYLFSIVALLQFIFIIFFPNFIENTQIALTDQKEWVYINDTSYGTKIIQIPLVAIFGFNTGETLNIFGIELSRMRSYLSEPSLIPLYFMFPVSISMIIGLKYYLKYFIILTFCFLTFSGSFQFCLFYALIYFVLKRLFSNKFILNYVPIIQFFIFYFILMFVGVQFFSNFDSQISQTDYSSFAKGNSLLVRFQGLYESFIQIIISPFGSNFDRTLPFSIFTSSVLASGWFGTLILFIFFKKLIYFLNSHLLKKTTPFITIGVSLFFGFFCMIIIFNDYGLFNYSGFLLLSIFYSLLNKLSTYQYND